MKDDERQLKAAVIAGERPREAAVRLDIHPKRVYYLCLKWASQGWYEYGVAADLGWAIRSLPQRETADTQER